MIDMSKVETGSHSPFTPGTYQMGDPAGQAQSPWQRDFGLDPTLANQEWARDPSWGDHVIWNRYMGYQDAPTMANWYNQQGGQYSMEDLMGAFTPQLGNDWSQYYGDRPTGGGQSTGDPVRDQGMVPGGDWQSWLDNYFAGQSGQSDPSGAPNAIYGGFPTIEGQNIAYPSQWGDASNVLTNFAYGDTTAIPESWDQGAGWLQSMGETGNPTDVQAVYDAWLPTAQRHMEEFSNQAAEEKRLKGLRWSTPLQNQITRESSRMTEDFGLSQAQAQIQASEAAKARQSGAISQAYQYGAGEANLGETARDRALAASQGLTGLGSLYAQYPMDLAQQGMQMGLQMQGAEQTQIDALMAELRRMLPENSPWLNMAMSATNMPYNTGDQTYQSSAGTDFLSLIAGIAPFFGKK